MGIQHVSGRSDCSSVLLGEQSLKCHLNGSMGMKGSSREWVRWRAHCCKNRSGEAAREADRLGVRDPGVSLRGLAGLLSPTSFAGLLFRGVFPVGFSGLRLRGVFAAFPKACKRENEGEKIAPSRWIHTWTCIAGGTTNVRLAFEGDPWLLGGVLPSYESAV